MFGFPPALRRPARIPFRLLFAALVLAGAFAFPAHHASACCDVIPQPDDFDRSALGSITRPALIPGFPAAVRWGWTTLSIGAELGILAAFAILMLAAAIRSFERQT